MAVKLLYSKKAPNPVGPYSQATEAGGFLYISGIIPINPENNELELFGGDALKQTQRIMNTLKEFLEDQKLSLKNVVKTTIFLKDMNSFQKVNEVYSEFFTDHKPARACVEVARLPKDVDVEIEAIVWRG